MAQWHKQMLKAKARKKSKASAGAEEMLKKKKKPSAAEMSKRREKARTMTQTLIKKADTFEPEEMADILLLLKSGDVDIARHAWHSYMWSARLTEVLEVNPTDFSDESGVHGVHQVSD